MKYINSKRYKFSSVLKYINFKRYKFSTILKYINLKRYKPNNIFKYIDLKRYKPNNIFKYIDFKKYIITKIYDISKIYRRINFTRYKYIPIYFFIFFVFLIIIYLIIPVFFKYDKLEIKNTLCNELNIKCSIQGEVKYSPLPSPRLKFDNLLVKDFIDGSKTLGNIENVSIKLSIYSLINKNKFNIKKIKFENFKINFDLEKISEYKKFLNNKSYSKSVSFAKGEINFLEKKQHIATIRDVNLKYKFNRDNIDATLNGDFIGDKIIINFESDRKKKTHKTLVIKLLDSGIFTKINIINNDSEKDVISGNFLFKKEKSRLTAIFDYKDDKIIIKKSNLRNVFLDGKLNGELKFLPYFDFNLDLVLNSVNFNRLYGALVSLDKKSKEKLFKINKKINGHLSMSANKIFSKHTIINSFESQVKFINGNILFEQVLLNLGKLGAADISGTIKNDEKFSNFKFENNIYLDNLKRFYNKFGIYNKQKIPYNLFISGNFDLVKLILYIDEISDENKFKDDDIEFITKEFNNILLEDGYASFFNFNKFKEFIRLVASEDN